jgi:hypothetical protein
MIVLMTDRILVAGVEVSRVGLTLSGLGATGQFGEPADRTGAVATIRAALNIGMGMIEVPVPFGPWADMLRDAGAESVTDESVVSLDLTDGTGADADGRPVLIAARLTGHVEGPVVVSTRFGRKLKPGLLLVPPDELEEVKAWQMAPVGVVVGPGTLPSHLGEPAELAAVRGPWPAPWRIEKWCRRHELPYLGSSLDALDAWEYNVALIPARSVAEVERLAGSASAAPTPPVSGPL